MNNWEVKWKRWLGFREASVLEGRIFGEGSWGSGSGLFWCEVGDGFYRTGLERFSLSRPMHPSRVQCSG